MPFEVRRRGHDMDHRHDVASVSRECPESTPNSAFLFNAQQKHNFAHSSNKNDAVLEGIEPLPELWKVTNSKRFTNGAVLLVSLLFSK